MTRFVFVPGIWQIVSAAAALAQHHDLAAAREEDVLVLYGHDTPEVKASMEAMAQQVWSWRRVIWADDVLVSHFPTRRFAPEARRTLHERAGSEADEIWVCKLYADPTKLAVYAYPRARLILYEDGAEEFFDHQLICGGKRLRNLPCGAWPGGIRREISHWTGAPECLEIIGCCSRQRRRVERLYSYMVRTFEVPAYLRGVPVTRIENACLMDRLRAIRRAAGDVVSAQVIRDPRAVLFLPQVFAGPISCTEDEEVTIYREAIADLLGAGYRVYWKEHPRKRFDFFHRIREAFGSEKVQMLNTPAGLPVECAVEGWELAAVVSVSSSALIYLHGLYGFPAYSLATRVPERVWKYPGDAVLARLFARYVPSLDVLLNGKKQVASR